MKFLNPYIILFFLTSCDNSTFNSDLSKPQYLLGNISKKDTTITLKWYDENYNFKYSKHLNITDISLVKIRFKSNRTFIDKNRIDTMEVSIENLPSIYQAITVPKGVHLKRLNDNSYRINLDNKFIGEKIKLKIGINQNLIDSIPKIINIDSILVDVH